MTSVVDVGWSFSEAEGAHKRVAGKDKEEASTLTQACVECNLHIVWRYNGAYARSQTHTGTHKNRQTDRQTDKAVVLSGPRKRSPFSGTYKLTYAHVRTYSKT